VVSWNESRHGAGDPQRGAAWRWPVLLLVLALTAAGIATWRYDLDERLFPDGLPWAEAPAPDPVTQPEQVPPPPGLELPEATPARPVAKPLDGTGDVATRKVRNALRAGLADPGLGRQVGVLVATLDGTPVYGAGETRVTPASTTKLLTTTAALEVLGPDHTFTTAVVRGRGKRDVVLVGGGDPYLMSSRAGVRAQPFPPRADLATLAKRTARALREEGVRKVRVSYDDSLFAGPTSAATWQPDYLTEQVVAPITALWVDGGRPGTGYGRVGDPSAYAAARFVVALGKEGIAVESAPTRRRAPNDAPELAAVSSAPLAEIVERINEISDNEGAEVLGHHVGLAVSGVGSFEEGAAAVEATLRDLGVPLGGARLYDGSGLSRADRLPLRSLVGTLAVAASDDHPELRPVLTGLSVPGFSGSLHYRFQTADPDSLPRVRAKTGTLVEGGVHGLAGLVTDADGTPLLFAVVADEVPVPKTGMAREALDEIVGALATCHCSR